MVFSRIRNDGPGADMADHATPTRHWHDAFWETVGMATVHYPGQQDRGVTDTPDPYGDIHAEANVNSQANKNAHAVLLRRRRAGGWDILRPEQSDTTGAPDTRRHHGPALLLNSGGDRGIPTTKLRLGRCSKCLFPDCDCSDPTDYCDRCGE